MPQSQIIYILAFYVCPTSHAHPFMAFYARPTFYGGVPHKLCKSSLFMKMCPTSYRYPSSSKVCHTFYSHPSFLFMCLTNYADPCCLSNCTSQVTYILAFYEGVPHRLITPSLFIKMFPTSHTYPFLFNPKSTGLFPPGAALAGVFSTPLCKLRSRHLRKLKFTGSDSLCYVLQTMQI